MADILVVHCDMPVRRMIREVLTLEGYTVSGAADGQEGLAWLRAATTPTIVLLADIMPIMDGPMLLHAATHDPALITRHAYIYITWRVPIVAEVREWAGVPQDVPLFELLVPVKVADLLAVVKEAAQRLAEA